MIKLIKYILIIIAGSLLISFAALYVVNAGLKKQQNDSFYTLNHIFYANEDHNLLMIGNSRCKNNLNPKIIDSIAGINSFNTGNYNFKIIEYKLMLELYLASGHPKPDYVLITLDNKVLNTDIEFYFPQQFFPYINNDIIYNSLHEYSDDYFIEKYLPFIGITRYNDYMKYLSMKGFLNSHPADLSFYKGFLPMSGGNAVREANKKDAAIEPTEKGLKLLNEFFDINKTHGIKVFVILPPFYHGSNETERLSEKFYHEIDSVINKFSNIKVFDMTHAEINKEQSLFFDKGHLNAKGAQVFSQIIADSLRQNMDIKP